MHVAEWRKTPGNQSTPSTRRLAAAFWLFFGMLALFRQLVFKD
jgi:hypothetical protein